MCQCVAQDLTVTFTISVIKENFPQGLVYIIIFSQRMIEVSTADIDFYEGKIKTLEEDNFYMHEQIIKLRTRLRTAEDFEIKYSLVVQANQRQMEKLRANMERQEEARLKEVVTQKLKENDEYWMGRFKESQDKMRSEADAQIEKLRKELTTKEQELCEIRKKSEQVELFGFKMSKLQKENQNLRAQLEETRRFHEKQRGDEIAKIRNILSNTYREKIENQQNKYESRIAQMQARLHEYEVKDDNITYKASDATNKELQTVKTLLEEKSRQYAKELQECRLIAQTKNQQISALLKEKLGLEDRCRKESKEQKDYIRQVQDKLLEREKQHEIQLLNQLERIKSASDQEKQYLQEQIKNLNAEIARSQQLWDEKILNHQNEIEELNNKFEEERRKFSEEKNQSKRKISQLSLRIKEAEGDREVGETEMLINSLKDTDAKGDLLGNYQNGITFLQRLNKKCQLKLQEKSRTVSRLFKEINDIRTQAETEIAELKQKIRKDRRETSDRILALQHEVRDLSDKLKTKDKQARKREREFLKEKAEWQEQRAGLKEMNDELQRDYNRVIEGKKEAETSFRDEREKSFMSKNDLNMVKKQKWLQLQKQKNQLQIIFKQKEEQIKLTYQQQLDDMKNERNKLKQDYEIAKQENDQLRRESQRLSDQLQMNKENDKMAEYNKKMATLNLELALTQNIYDSLKKAKSRIEPSSCSPAEFVLEDVQQDVEEPLMISFHPSTSRFK